ncbi:uncharacterized protein MONOS_13228 [Monocercomonoides exilis]|uniref:uncharacterized protein n=1 Tax=Monocercomonoides exilis TaxID=2049356 RepID=UPI00355A1655|nr:hypothetical protein MONOS_13228 [Monocercomonoides exilis]|eukprot:MONOS_13228.1-p1 / transcript=MONOS_13228.1 / gene=MONOS_13228 / organism=Monocercomonoides_exilis_PA203 / gene_product=unspecified product / transcript_product=unspecified product / location=Mono_scaffold00794:10202-10486(-) / protein_length=95 / sequence_SO=supercontig / SO=protein_coding / is_pseudo=false
MFWRNLKNPSLYNCVDEHSWITEKTILQEKLSFNYQNHIFAYELTLTEETFNLHDEKLIIEADMRLLQNLLHLPFYLDAAPLGSKTFWRSCARR